MYHKTIHLGTNDLPGSSSIQMPQERNEIQIFAAYSLHTGENIVTEMIR